MRCADDFVEDMAGDLGAGDTAFLTLSAGVALGLPEIGYLPFTRGFGKEERMEVCVPTRGPGGLDDQVGEHFGRVPTYTLYDTDTGEVEILPNTSQHMGGTGLPAELLAQAGVDVVICSGLGRRALALLEENGIEVYIGASGTVREAVQAWQEGRLSLAQAPDACNRHMFHGH